MCVCVCVCVCDRERGSVQYGCENVWVCVGVGVKIEGYMKMQERSMSHD